MKWLARAWLAVWLGLSVAVAGGLALGLLAPISDHRLERALDAPAWPHLMGFDAFGRDLLAITLQGALTSMLFAAAATLITIALALAAGTLIAVAPERARFAASRALETMLAFPSLLFALAWAAVRGPGWSTLAISMLLGSVPPLIRLVQARAREVLAEDYVLAARSLGAGPLRIATRHLAPGVVSLCRVKAPNLFASALMAEATLSFLGLGAPIGRDTWGTLLAQGKDYLLESPHLALGAGLPLALTLLAVQSLSPRSRHEV